MYDSGTTGTITVSTFSSSSSPYGAFSVNPGPGADAPGRGPTSRRSYHGSARSVWATPKTAVAMPSSYMSHIAMASSITTSATEPAPMEATLWQ